jgi:hypothetical protein
VQCLQAFAPLQMHVITRRRRAGRTMHLLGALWSIRQLSVYTFIIIDVIIMIINIIIMETQTIF